MLDDVFGEDVCRLISENGHKTLNAFRKLALLIHRQYLKKTGKKSSVKANLLACLINPQLLWEILASL
jgi:hypothetical protein